MDGRDDQDDLDDNSQLDPADTLVGELDPGADPLDEGYSPVERPWVVDGRADEHEDLGRRLARELPDVPLADEDPTAGDGIGDTADTDGEAWDAEVGDIRAGRLLADAADPDVEAIDVGIDGGGASAEEAAMHEVAAESDR